MPLERDGERPETSLFGKLDSTSSEDIKSVVAEREDLTPQKHEIARKELVDDYDIRRARRWLIKARIYVLGSIMIVFGACLIIMAALVIWDYIELMRSTPERLEKLVVEVLKVAGVASETLAIEHVIRRKAKVNGQPPDVESL